MQHIFNRSVYYCVRGSIVEVPLQQDQTFVSTNYSVSVGTDLAAQSDWVVDYTGKVIKNRRPDKLSDIADFLKGSREPDFICNTLEEMQNTTKLITKVVVNFTNKGIQPNSN
ncbi:hypothetical protein Ac42p149 [Acinetobacter phage Ac42]|uniref:hypothetical protein n=1 Tax=Acinetobacter phage Ac42 TaxID=762660 RepID=UPI0001EBCD6C|nr:hypothetical protein Ac42p149 [Acinetobacter phage Ac42]ADI96387.1 hypothetical protein Ac42p149 [Acinetobacter phage Ac42]